MPLTFGYCHYTLVLLFFLLICLGFPSPQLRRRRSFWLPHVTLYSDLTSTTKWFMSCPRSGASELKTEVKRLKGLRKESPHCFLFSNPGDSFLHRNFLTVNGPQVIGIIWTSNEGKETKWAGGDSLPSRRWQLARSDLVIFINWKPFMHLDKSPGSVMFHLKTWKTMPSN